MVNGVSLSPPFHPEIPAKGRASRPAACPLTSQGIQKVASSRPTHRISLADLVVNISTLLLSTPKRALLVTFPTRSHPTGPSLPGTGSDIILRTGRRHVKAPHAFPAR